MNNYRYYIFNNRLWRIALTALIFGAVIFSFILPAMPVAADAILVITPINWNVVGLDSNNVNVGPDNFPVGARVCNSGTPASNVVATFAWDDHNDLFTGDSYINLRKDSLSSINLITLAGSNTCHDFYFEVTIKRDPNAYNKTRRYNITVTANGGISQTTPQPRESYVEHLISQNRNSTNDVKLDGTSIPAGGSMSLMVGNTYNIELHGSTATQGYEQLEAFINFPNTIFQTNTVTTTYSADAGSDPLAHSKLYANGCNWENDPNSPNYRSCWSTGKYGGTVTVLYNVTIIGGAGTSENLSTLIYDFSGSSYHYNSDFSTTSRVVNIIGPSSISMVKRFIPDSITPGGTSTLMLTISNPTAVTINGVKFTDPLPTNPPYAANMLVATTPNKSTTGCGSPTFDPHANDASLTFSNGSIAPNSSCIIKVDVTAASADNYLNTTNHLFINDTTDTGSGASATLTAASAASCTPGITMTNWTIPNANFNPPDKSGGLPTTKASNVFTATASAYTSGSTIIDSSNGSNDTYSWKSWGYKDAGQYLSFVVDTRHFSAVSLSFYSMRTNGGADPTTVYLAYDKGSGYTPILTTTLTTGFVKHTLDFTGLTSASGSTRFKIYASGANNNNSGAAMYVDNLLLTGCSHLPPPPTISKAFATTPIKVNSVSKLTFTINNKQTGYETLTGVQFNDPLPTGLQVADTPNYGTDCSGSPTWAPTSGATTLTFGNPAGATLGANGSCTAWVDIKATQAGQFDNISGYISATESGVNKSSNGYATANLTAVSPPSITKAFGASPILTGDSTSLSFKITNPNQNTALSGIVFTDTLPSGVTVATTSSLYCGGTLSTTNPNDISFSGGSLAANSSCTMTATVAGGSAGIKNNQTGYVSSTEGGAGNRASATLEVRNAATKLNLLKQVSLNNSGPWTSFVAVNPPLVKDVYFKFTLENTGDITLTTASITDVTLPGLDLSDCTAALSGGLGLYASQTCISAAQSITTTGAYTNTAYSTGNSVPSNNTSARYDTTELTLAKRLAESNFAGTGNVLHYTYAVTNTGAAPLQGPVTVADDKASDESCPSVTTVGDKDNYLDPGESITCTASYTVQSSETTVTNLASATADGVTSNTDTQTATQADMDFGDLPGVYNDTLWADNGARHILGSLYLGATKGAKIDGTEDPNAAADLNDDGVTMTGDWNDGSGNLDVMVSGGKGCLMGWLDYWNGSTPYTPDGDFSDSGEVIINNQPVNTGITPFSFTLPFGAASNVTWFARFRLVPDLDNDGNCTDQTAIGLSGVASNGEVEDYRIHFSPTNITLERIAANPSVNVQYGWWVAWLCMIILAGITWRWLFHRRCIK